MTDPAVSGAGDAPGRLPRPRTSFVGRESDLAQARHLLGHNRLLTLTGPGGCGKTRLSIALAARVMGAFPEGVRFVPLAAISDASLVPVSIAQGMGLQDSRDGPLLEHLSGYLGDRKLLLVLDNFEHVLAAGEFVQELLAGSTQLRILVTSRSPLHLSGEQEFPVPALRVPEPGGAPSVTAVAACESAQLFAARAAALVPGFAIDEHNAGAIAGIVERLDGLPLAIELAAARVKLLPPAAILARLEDSLGLLVSGGRDAPDRQRTLRAAISWSYDLLSEAARRLLAAASVFRGGINLERIEAVCAEALHLGVPVLDALQQLVDHSLLRLVVPSAPVPRYAMLETVREFAAGRLSTMPDAAAIRAAHAGQFGRLANDLARPPCWPARDGLDLLELEHDNFRVALDWYHREDPSAALRLANRLTAFWSARGHFSEGRRRLGELLELVPDDDPERVDALSGAAWLATDQGDRASAIPLLDESIGRARATHDVVREATALYYRGRAKQIIGDPAGGGADIERAWELQTDGGGADLAAALWWAGAAAMFEDDLGLAIERFERCAELSGALGLPAIEARALQLLGVSRLELGDLHGARSALGKGVPAIAGIGDRFAIAVGLSALAGLAAKVSPRARGRAVRLRPQVQHRVRRRAGGSLSKARWTAWAAGGWRLVWAFSGRRRGYRGRRDLLPGGWRELDECDAADLAARLLGHAIYAPAACTGWMHADLHSGNFLLLPGGRLGMLDFGAVAATPGGIPAPFGQLAAAVLAGDGPAAIRLARKVGALAPDDEVDPRLIIELLHPLAATGADTSFTYSRAWLRGLMAHLTEPRFAPALRNLTPPPQYALLSRATLSAAGLFAQLGATVPTRGFHLAYSPGFRDSISPAQQTGGALRQAS